ncbi:ARM repeat-containing protein [Schizopora paradoxa]|uniref:ARM repeat-containing protein n=1 Tax=Schizopora paradoxa TaxID=27342 RepID=A0A0H2S2U3_9AGAM|nr:ARM repeat-containing protein [Schizopora paradoxa]
MSQQTADKPSLSGVKIKARKGAVKKSAKYEPSTFRDQLYSYLETVPEGDFTGFYNQLVQAGSTLEFLKYADPLFEILLAGGLLQPGGQYVQDGAPMSPFSILKAKEPAEIDDLKKYVDVFNKLIRRYKYLQRPLEETSLPSVLQYVSRWEPEQQAKFAMTVGLLMGQGIVTAACLQTLTKEAVVKNDVAISVVTFIFKAYLSEQSMDHLGSNMRKNGIKDLTMFLPPNKRNLKTVEDHFRKEGLAVVADYVNKRQTTQAKDVIIKTVKEMCKDDSYSNEEMTENIKGLAEEQRVTDTDLLTCLWQGLMSSIDFSQEQLDASVIKTIEKFAPILEGFCSSGKNQVALINEAQLYCYEEKRITKLFPQILKVLYNKDCISTQAIQYWHQKGSKTQGRAHFLQSASALVEYLKKQEEEDSEEEDEEEA